MLLTINDKTLEFSNVDETKPLPSLLKLPLVIQQHRIGWVVLRFVNNHYTMIVEPVEEPELTDDIHQP